MEMLIVVAIIVILVAVSIPTFTAQLDKAKSATDDANLRAAKAVALNHEMMGSWGDLSKEAEVYYDVDNAVFVKKASITEADHGQSSANGSNYIIVKFTDGKMDSGYPQWDEPAK